MSFIPWFRLVNSLKNCNSSLVSGSECLETAQHFLWARQYFPAWFPGKGWGYCMLWQPFFVQKLELGWNKNRKVKVLVPFRQTGLWPVFFVPGKVQVDIEMFFTGFFSQKRGGRGKRRLFPFKGTFAGAGEEVAFRDRSWMAVWGWIWWDWDLVVVACWYMASVNRGGLRITHHPPNNKAFIFRAY